MQTLLCIHASDELYGSDRMLYELLRNATRYNVILVLPNDVPYSGQLSERLRAHGVTVHHANIAVLRRHYFTPRGFLNYLRSFVASLIFLTRLIRREKPALVLTNTIVVLPGVIAAFLNRIPHIWYIHEMVTKPRILWRLTSTIAVLLSRKIVCPSEAVKQHLQAGAVGTRADNIVVIHNAIEVAPFNAVTEEERTAIRRQWECAPQDALVGMVGRIGIWKGQEDFILAARTVVKKHPNTKFVVVGSPVPGREYLYDELKQSIAANHLEKHFVLSGFRIDIPEIMHALDIFVLPSTEPEPFGLVLLEAMAARCPVVAYAHGGPQEIVEERQTGLLAQPNAPSALAEAIDFLLQDAERREAYGNAGYTRLQTHFTKQHFVDEWQKLLYDQSSR